MPCGGVRPSRPRSSDDARLCREVRREDDPPLTTCDTADKGRFSIRSPYLANDGSVPYDSDVALSYGAEAVGTASRSFSLTGEAMLSSSGTSLAWCGSSVMIVALRFDALRRCTAFAPANFR